MLKSVAIDEVMINSIIKLSYLSNESSLIKVFKIRGEKASPKFSHATAIPNPVPKALGITTRGIEVQVQTEYIQ